MDNTVKTLLELIKCSVFGETFVGTVNDWDKVFSLAKKHGVLSTVYPALKDLPLPERLKANADAIIGSLVAQQANQDYYMQEIENAFSGAGIKFIPLKGARTRSVYPSPEMRISSDVDIYIDEADKKLADFVMKDLGLAFTKIYDDSANYEKPPYITVELHDKLDSYVFPDYYRNVWEKAKNTVFTRYEFSDDDFYIYNLLHVLKHFSCSGTGIRTILDVFLLNTRLRLNRDYVDGELEKLSLKKFERCISELGYVWFGSLERNDFYDDLTDYVVASGIYGNVSNRTVNEMSGRHGKIGYFLKRVFPPYRSIVKSQPWLKKCPFLLPVGWIIRIFKLTFGKREMVKDSIRAIKQTEGSAMEKQKTLFENLGIENYY